MGRIHGQTRLLCNVLLSLGSFKCFVLHVDGRVVSLRLYFPHAIPFLHSVAAFWHDSHGGRHGKIVLCQHFAWRA
ncbi:hypothetical protein CC80DRAFT_97513 [Byssothecium circinans]|uniref:Secreted protein n=1 Tax=Byssothecium circinans TaxID=147558 RepID=A0A6A5UG81_9PLEO|nr:hypothetical protein CC80DRAFT_97513 [Byssothecium circinans]